MRRALLAALDEKHGDDRECRVIPELALCGRVRVDVAILNGYMSGFEIKSPRDTLRRLPTQAEVYSEVLDFATLVVGGRHQANAVSLVPPWWGVLSATVVGDEVELVEERRGTQNPAVSKRSLSLLLWRDEALDELGQRDLADGVRSLSRAALCGLLASTLELDDLRDTVRRRLKGRKGWRSDL